MPRHRLTLDGLTSKRRATCRPDTPLIVLDLFGGSGTTLIAAERTGRRARLLEIEPRYVDVTIARFEQVTKADAVLGTTGQTYAEVAAERRIITTKKQQ